MEQVIIEKSKLDEIDTELKSHEDEIQEFRDCYAIQRANVEDNNANNSISTVERISQWRYRAINLFFSLRKQ